MTDPDHSRVPMPQGVVAEEEPDFEGAFELRPFRMDADEEDKIWFTGTDGESQEYEVEGVRDFLQESLIHPIEGLEGKELLMAWILKRAKGEQGKNRDLAAGIQQILESDSGLKAKLEEKMEKTEVLAGIKKIEDRAGISES